MKEQMVFKRYEMKYLISGKLRRDLQPLLDEYMVPDVHGRNVTCSLYFDTPFFLLARRSAEHPVYKEKVRLRSYGVTEDSTKVFLELKKKYEGVVYKRRIGMSQKEADEYIAFGRMNFDNQITREIDYCFKLYEGLAPACLISYQREAFYGKDNHDFRITFDDTILYRNENLSLREGIYGEKIIGDDDVLMEVKTASSVPLWLVHFLSEHNIYKTSFSKYGTAYRKMQKKEG